jgi:hypothetical protein
VLISSQPGFTEPSRQPQHAASFTAAEKPRGSSENRQQLWSVLAGGQRERLHGGSGPAAALHPLQDGAARQPRRPQHQSLPTLLADALDETVIVTIEAIVTQIGDYATRS